MFQLVETPLDDDKFAYLERFSFEGDELVVSTRQGGKMMQITFSGVVGLTFSEDLLGSNGGQITRDDGEKVPVCILCRSEKSATLAEIRAALEAYRDKKWGLVHYRLHLREHMLSLVSKRQIISELVEDGQSA